MKAVILAAGKGTRMKELTAELPKPMLRVTGRPVLEHIIRGIAGAGVREFLIVTGYRAVVIEEYFCDGKNLGVSITYIRQEIASGTGSAALLAKDFVGSEPFLLTYGDILTAPENYRAMIQAVAARVEGGSSANQPRLPRAATIHGLISTWHGEDLTKGGAVLVGDDGYVTDIVEKGKAADLKTAFYNAGIYIFPPQIFAALATIPKSPRGEYELTDAIKQVIRDGKKLGAFALKDYWLDVRDAEVLEVAGKILGSMTLHCAKCNGTDFEALVQYGCYILRCACCRELGPMTSWIAIGPTWDREITVFKDGEKNGSPLLSGVGSKIWHEISRLASDGTTLILR